MPHPLKMPLLLLLACTALLVAVPAGAVVTNFTDFASYAAAAGPQAEATFGELPVGTYPVGPYPTGYFFFDGSDQIVANGSFVTDGVGLDGNGDIEVGLPFIARSIAVDYPGAVHFDLYKGSDLVGSSANFGGSGTGFFGGVVSTLSFDRVRISDWFEGHTFIDNLYTASDPVLPEPGTLALVAFGILSMAVAARRRG